MLRFQSVGRMSLVVIAMLSMAIAAPEANAQCKPLSITPPGGPIPGGTVGIAYKPFTITVDGGVAPYTPSPSAPQAGLGFQEDPRSGVAFGGTPTAPGKYAFTIGFKDSDKLACTGSATYDIVVDCPIAITTLSAPANGATLTTDSPGFTWSAVSGATGYDVLISTDGGSSFTVLGSSTTTSFNSPALKPGKYDWVVDTNFAGKCPSTRSAARSFTISLCGSGEAKPLSPGGGGIFNSGTTTFSWAGVSGATGYEVQLAPAGGTFSTIGSTTNTSLSSSLSNGDYSWRVVTNFGQGCKPSVSVAETFKVLICGTGSADLGSPADGAVINSTSVTLSWSAVSLATGYDVQFSTDGGATFGDVVSTTGTSHTATLKDAKYTWRVITRFETGCKSSVSATRSFTIDTAPKCPSMAIGPSTLPPGTVGLNYKVELTVTGGVAPHLFTASGLPAGLTMDKAGLIFGEPTAAGTSTVRVDVVDNNGCPASTSYSLTITSPKCPVINAGPSTLPGAIAGAKYEAVLSAEGGVAPHTFSVDKLPAGLSFEKNVIFGVPTTAGSFTILVNITDANGCTGSSSLSLTVAGAKCPIITVNPLSLSNGTVGLPYKGSVSATGGFGAYKFTSSGNFPSGLALSGDSIFGTPNVAGTYDFSITATDDNGCSGTRAYTIVIAGGGCPTITVGPSLLPSGTTGVPYKTVTLSATGGLGPYSFAVTANSLPPGLSLSGAEIGGTPTTAGSFKFEITATDANRCSGSTTYIIDVEESGTICSIQVSPASLANGTVGTDYKVGLLASGGTIPYNFEVVGTLPPGLSLSGNTIFGTPTTAGIFRFDIRVSDGRRCATSVSYSLTIAPRPSACGTGEPSNVAPEPDQEFRDVTSITYAWNGVKGATGYDVLLSGDGGRSFAVEVSTTGESSTKVSAPAKAGKFLWLVRANFGPDCKPTISTQSGFSVVTSSSCPTAAPQQIQPANNATNVSTTVVFEWTAVEGASRYTIIATMNGETTALATTTATIIKVPVTPGKISWKVRAEFLTKCTATESTSSFTFDTEQPIICSLSPAKTRLLAPGNGASAVASPVSFEWGAVSGATSYNLFALIDTGSLLEASKPQLLGSTPDTKLSATVPEGTITWYVETMFGKCPSSISESFVFKSASGSRCDNAPTTLSAPVGNASVSSPVTFSWSPMKGAVSYHLFVAFNGSTTFSKVADTPGSSFTQRIAPGTHSWFVATEYFGCKPVSSATATFTVIDDTKCSTEPVALRAPAAGSTVTSPVSFDWSPLGGVDAYQLTVAVNGVTVINEKVAGPPQTREISSGKASWSITPLSGTTCRIPPSSGTFTVQARNTCDTNVAAAPQSPSNNRFEVSGTAASVDFRWNAAPNAIGYTVEVALPGQAFGEIGSTKGNEATTLTRDLKPGSYSWRVVTLFAGCNPLPSNPLTFEIVDVGERCSAATPGLIFPAARAQDVTSPTTFLWSSVPGAIAYRVYLNGGVLTDPDLDASRTSFTATLSPGPATWSVEAVFKSCSANRATDVAFSVQQATVCPSDKPELVFPGKDADNVSQLVEFSWKPISGATTYTLFTKSENGRTTSAAETNLTSAREKMPSGERIEWYVIASVPGCTAIESEHSFFTTSADCSDRGPILQDPQSDARDLGSPVSFSWTSVPNALEYNLWIGDRNDKTSIRLVTTTRATKASIDLDAGAYVWFVESVTDQCTVPSAVAFFTVAATQGADCDTPDQPIARAVGQVLSETAYIFRFTPVLNAQSYEVQESATADFASPTTIPVNENEVKFVHTVSSPTTFYYRVRAISSCNDDRSQFSPVVEVDIVTKNTIDKKTLGTAEIGVEQVVIQTLFIPGGDAPISFSATVDRPWMAVVPSEGIVPVEGLTLNITADPAFLGVGSNVGTVLISYGGAGKLGQQTNSGPTTVPVNVSLVTPVVPGGKNGPQLDSLIIPAVGHALGANNSLFQSDVRVVNTSTQTMKYQLNFTPSRSDATLTGRSTTIQIAPGGTAALDDILTSFFGTAASETATGALEIRPLTSSATSTSSRATGPTLASPTVASSRTYNLTANGTLGQFIPAVPFASFIGKNSDGTRALLSLQQIAESNAYRTNFGLVEGSGQPASGLLSVFDGANALVAEIPFSLQAGEHQQLDRLLGVNNISLEEGRIEVEVTSETGKVTAYASTIDNRTNDPLLVTPVLKSAITGTRYIVPGVAFIDGPARWRSDVRIYNAANTEQSATVTFFPQGNVDGAQSQQVSLKPGEVLALDNILVTMFGATSTIGGSLLVSTPQTSSLVATARTYAVTDAGTYGQFVPAVTANEATAMGGRALNILQVEQSINMRTNIGLVETTGKSAMAEVSLILPDTKFTPKVQIPLDANGFTQFNLASFNVGNAVYNARVSVKVISGSGRVAAYGSVIDNKTLDPTYVPAQ